MEEQPLCLPVVRVLLWWCRPLHLLICGIFFLGKGGKIQTSRVPGRKLRFVPDGGAVFGQLMEFSSPSHHIVSHVVMVHHEHKATANKGGLKSCCFWLGAQEGRRFLAVCHGRHTKISDITQRLGDKLGLLKVFK